MEEIKYKKYTHPLSIVSRLKLMERLLAKLNKKAGWYCDWCGRKAKFQRGLNITNKIGTWCSDKCFQRGNINRKLET